MAKQNKEDAQIAKAREHKLRLAEAKARRRQEPVLARKEPILEEKPIILIYCEGKNTGPSYFKRFRIETAIVKAYGEGKNTLSLVKEAKKIADKAKKSGKAFEQVWCVFDADPKADNPKQLENFNRAIALSNQLGFGTAYSNQAFEYWLILHFEDHQGGSMPRSDYDPKLNTYLKPYELTYDGNDSKIVTHDMFNVLFEKVNSDIKGQPVTRTDLAIKRAKKIFSNSGDHSNPGKEESSTTVFRLVEELLKIK